MTISARTLSSVAAATATAASALAYPFLPRRVATHFDMGGKPDRFGSRTAAALGLPAVMAGITIANDRLGGWPGGRDREDSRSGAQARNQAVGIITWALLPAHLATLANGKGLHVESECKW